MYHHVEHSKGVRCNISRLVSVTETVYCAVRTESYTQLLLIVVFQGSAMVLAVSRGAVPLEARVRSQASPGEILGAFLSVSFQKYSLLIFIYTSHLP